jgi:hypothetical protein
MKINRTKSKKPLFIFLSFLLFVSGVFYFWYSQMGQQGLKDSNKIETKSTRINLEAPSSEQINTGYDIKKAALEGANGPPDSSNVSYAVSITAVNQNSSTVQVRGLIQGILEKGECTLTLSKGGQSFAKHSSIQTASNNTTCRGFDIPLNEVSAGTWQLQLSVSSNKGSGYANSSMEIR